MDLEPMSELSLRGMKIYENKLRPLLEPEHSGEFVAIHVPSEDYTIGRYSGDATREILKIHPPDGQLVILKIGPEPDSLVSRYLAGQALAARRR